VKQDCEIKRLGDLFTFKNGRAFKKEEWSDSGLPIIRIQNLNSEDALFNRFAGEYSQDIFVGSGDLLFSWSGTIGSSFGSHIWNGKPGLLNQHIFKVAHRESIDRRYAFYGLRFITAEIEKSVSGAVGLVHITKAKLNEFTLPLPPLSEQQRIVDVLDKAFEGLATVKVIAEQNLQNARALFDSHLDSKLSEPGKGWKTTTLGAEIDLLAGFAFKSAQYTNDDDGIRLLRGDNIVQGRLRWDDVKKWPGNDAQDYARYQLAEGDVVLAMDRPWVKAGLKHATIGAADLPCLLVQRTARLRGGANLDSRFLKLLVGAGAFTSHILGVQTGIGVPHISGQQIKDYEFVLPPFLEQQRIATNLESLRAETQHLASLYERKLSALEELKTSLLQQAFRGEL
jgi:restriction endonuclease S subunit